MAISVSIVEDNRGTRESLKELLGRAQGLRCVGAYSSGEEALKKIPEEKPDVVLMDINLPGMRGIECVAQLKARAPKTQVLMLTTYDESDLIFESLRAGAHGYLLKNTTTAGINQADDHVQSRGAPNCMVSAQHIDV